MQHFLRDNGLTLVLSLMLLSIVLRHRGSPESKPVAAANSETGT